MPLLRNINSGSLGVNTLGVLGSNIPSTGTDGPSLLYNDITPITDDNVHVKAVVTSTTDLHGGSLFVYEDGGLVLENVPDGTYIIFYDVYADGVSVGSTSATLNVGEISLEHIINFSNGATASGTGGITSYEVFSDQAANTNFSSLLEVGGGSGSVSSVSFSRTLIADSTGVVGGSGWDAVAGSEGAYTLGGDVVLTIRVPQEVAAIDVDLISATGYGGQTGNHLTSGVNTSNVQDSTGNTGLVPLTLTDLIPDVNGEVLITFTGSGSYRFVNSIRITTKESTPVAPPAAPVFSIPISDKSWFRNLTNTTVNLNSHFSGSGTYTVNGTLPTGVTLDGATGILTVIPTVNGVSPVSFTRTQGLDSATSNTVNFIVADKTPDFLSDDSFEGTLSLWSEYNPSGGPIHMSNFKILSDHASVDLSVGNHDTSSAWRNYNRGDAILQGVTLPTATPSEIFWFGLGVGQFGTVDSSLTNTSIERAMATALVRQVDDFTSLSTYVSGNNYFIEVKSQGGSDFYSQTYLSTFSRIDVRLTLNADGTSSWSYREASAIVGAPWTTPTVDDAGPTFTSSSNVEVGFTGEGFGEVTIPFTASVDAIKTQDLPDVSADLYPDVLVFTPTLDAERNVSSTSNADVIENVSAAVDLDLSVTGGLAIINGGTPTASAVVNLGDSIELVGTSSNSFSGVTTVTLTIAGVVSTYIITTRAVNNTITDTVVGENSVAIANTTLNYCLVSTDLTTLYDTGTVTTDGTGAFTESGLTADAGTYYMCTFVNGYPEQTGMARVTVVA